MFIILGLREVAFDLFGISPVNRSNRKSGLFEIIECQKSM